MMYGQHPRDRIAAALLEVANPSPRPQMPPMPGMGMQMPAVATPNTVASMGAQSPASPSFPGAMPQMPMSGGAPATPPAMPPVPGAPNTPGAGTPPPPMRGY